MKWVRICCIVVIILCLVFILSIHSKAEGGYLWMVDASSGVNVRDAIKNGQIITTLRKGDIIKVCYEDKLWVGYMLSDGSMGYCYKENLHIAHAEEIESWENRNKKGIKITNFDALAIGTILNDCNVYKTANGRIIGSYKEGDEVFIRQTGKYWYKIIWDDKEIGYVQAKNIEFSRPNIPAEGDYKKVICKNFAPIYEEANSDSDRVGKIKNGHYVVIIDDSDPDFSYVCYYADGRFGYISKKYLK